MTDFTDLPVSVANWYREAEREAFEHSARIRAALAELKPDEKGMMTFLIMQTTQQVRCEAEEAKQTWPYVKRCETTATHDVVISFLRPNVPVWEGSICEFHLDQAMHDPSVVSVEATPRATADGG